MKPHVITVLLVLAFFSVLAMLGYLSLTSRPEMSPGERPKWMENLEW